MVNMCTVSLGLFTKGGLFALLTSFSEHSTVTLALNHSLSASVIPICVTYFSFLQKILSFSSLSRSVNYLLSSCPSPGNAVSWAMAILTVWLHKTDQWEHSSVSVARIWLAQSQSVSSGGWWRCNVGSPFVQRKSTTRPFFLLSANDISDSDL